MRREMAAPNARAPARVELVPVDRHNYLAVVALCVSPEEERFVGTAAEAIADLHYLPGLELRAVQAEGVLVGLVLFEKHPASRTVVLRRLLVDCHHQRRGYASAAVRALAATAPFVVLSVHKDAAPAIALYNKLGFYYIPPDRPTVVATLFKMIDRAGPYPPDHHYAVLHEHALLDAHGAKSNIPFPPANTQ